MDRTKFSWLSWFPAKNNCMQTIIWARLYKCNELMMLKWEEGMESPHEWQSHKWEIMKFPMSHDWFAIWIFTYTVNIWGQSEGIEKAILPSVGIFSCNLNVLTDIKLNKKDLSLIFKFNYFFRGQKLCILKVLPLKWQIPIVSEKNWN
jgi:hypothetical protein